LQAKPLIAAQGRLRTTGHLPKRGKTAADAGGPMNRLWRLLAHLPKAAKSGLTHHLKRPWICGQSALPTALRFPLFATQSVEMLGFAHIPTGTNQPARFNFVFG